MITGLSDRLIYMSYLEELNLGHWSCLGLSLMSDHNQFDGFALEFLQRLKVLKLHNVSEKFFQAIGSYCPNLQRLHIFASDITNAVAWWVSKCQSLETIELFDVKDLQPIGYAQILQSNPNLKSLGKCDCFGQVLSLLYDKFSDYRRSYGCNLPEHLSLEEVDTNEIFQPSELKYMVKRCPNLKKLRFRYSRKQYQEGEHETDHLAELCAFDYLTQLSITRAHFFEHHIFQYLEVRGNQVFKVLAYDCEHVSELPLCLDCSFGARGYRRSQP